MPRRASALLALAWLTSCGSNDASNGAAGADQGAGEEAESDQDLIDSEADETTAAPSECARDTYRGERAEVNLYLLLDISGSMDAPIEVESTLTQWDAVRTAVSGFIESDASAGLNLALNYFPSLSARTNCNELNQCEANVPCITRICDLSHLLFGEAWPCSLDVECGLQVTLEGTTYRESCLQPGRCSNDPFQMCFVDLQCGDAASCQAPEGGLCPGEMSCDPAEYEEPAVPLTALPDPSRALLDSLHQHQPDMFGRTPTQVALAGAYRRVAEWQSADPGQRSVVVLATDGAPLGCNGTIAAEADAELAMEQTLDVIDGAQALGIDTFVIGVVPDLSGLTPVDQATFQPQVDALVARLAQMAQLGGTTDSFNVTASDTTTGDFLEALDQIRGQVLPCEYQIPEPEAGSVSFNQLNVELTDGTDTELVPKVSELDQCGGEGGWYYDADGTGGTPTRVILCPASCERVEAGTTSRVDIVLGCATIEKAR